MTKLQLTLTSLVAVIPGAFLIYLLVMAMLTQSENLSTMSYVIMGVTLLSMAITVLIPAGVMVGGGRRKSAAAKPVKSSKASAPVDMEEETGDIEALDEEVEVSEVMDDDADETIGEIEAESSEFDLGYSEELTEFGAESGMDLEDDTEPVEEFDSFEMDDIDLEEEEEQPKPKKKKR